MAYWYSFRVDLPDIGESWKGANIHDVHVWSNGNAGQDIWTSHPIGVASLSLSTFLDAPKPHVIINLVQHGGAKEPALGRYFAFIMRCYMGKKQKHMVLGGLYKKGDTTPISIDSMPA